MGSLPWDVGCDEFGFCSYAIIRNPDKDNKKFSRDLQVLRSTWSPTQKDRKGKEEETTGERQDEETKNTTDEKVDNTP